MFLGTYGFDDDVLLDCIESMSNLESKLSTVNEELGSTEDIVMSGLCGIEEQVSDSCDFTKYQTNKNNIKNSVPREVDRNMMIESGMFQSKSIAEWVHNYVKIIDDNDSKDIIQ